MRMPGYPAGVPSQYSVHVHPWPTRYHGPIYTRAEFHLPYVQSPFAVFKPGDFSATATAGLGASFLEWVTNPWGTLIASPSSSGSGAGTNPGADAGTAASSTTADAATSQEAPHPAAQKPSVWPWLVGAAAIAGGAYYFSRRK